MRLHDNSVRKISELAVLLAAALALSYVENMIVLPIPVPGVKIGISNVLLAYVVCRYSFPVALGFGISKCLLALIFAGRLSSVFFSLTGMLFAVIAMYLCRRIRCFSVLGVNVCGSVCHVFGQLLAAVFVLGNTAVLSFSPLLTLFAVISGLFTYIPLRIVLQRIYLLKNGKNL